MPSLVDRAPDEIIRRSCNLRTIGDVTGRHVGHGWGLLAALLVAGTAIDQVLADQVVSAVLAWLR